MDSLLVVFALASAVCYALGLVFTQFGLRSYPPISGACISVPTSMALFVALSPFALDLSGASLRPALIFAAVGVIFPALNTFLTFYANRLVGPSITGAFSNMTPVFAALLGGLVLGEVLTGGQTAAIGTVVCGAALIYLGRGLAVPKAVTWAILLPLAVAAIRALAQAVVKIGLAEWPSAYAATMISYVVSAAIVLTVGATRGALPRGGVVRDRLWFALVGVLNGLSVLFVYAALARGPVSVVSALVACFPLVVLAANFLIRGDRTLTPAMLAGMALTVGGVMALVLR